MYVVNTHLKPVIGIDIHFVNMPFPFVPIPHPYIGLVIDPFDYIPFIGATVKVNGVPRGNTNTMGMIITFVHIPFGAGFTLFPMIGHDSQNFFGSKKVMVDGAPMSGAGYMLMTCNDIGLPLSFRPGRKFIPIPSLYLPTSFCIPLQWGKPVHVGGPLVPNFSLMALLKAFVFGCFLKVLGKIAAKVMKKLSGKLSGKLGASGKLKSALCKMGFEPVDLVTGRVNYEYTDFEIPGAIPLRWTRNWDSDAALEGLLGHGVHLCYERYIHFFEEEGVMGMLLADGRAAAFPLLRPGEMYYHAQEKLLLRRKSNGNFLLEDFDAALYLHFNHHCGPDTWHLSFMENYSGNRVQFHYNGHQLQAITDSAGRRLLLHADSARRITSVELQARGRSQVLVQYGYSEAGDLTVIRDAMDQDTLIEYDDHLMIKKTDRNGFNFHWEYDEQRRCVHTYGEGGLLEGWIAYHEGYNIVTNSVGDETVYKYNEDNLCIQETDHYGNSRHTEYTDDLEIYRQTDEGGFVTGYIYDELSRLKEKVLPDGSAISFHYNAHHQPILIIYPDGNSATYGYDEWRRLRFVNHPDGETLSYAYNDKGQLETVVENGRHSSTLQYDDEDNLVGMQLPGGASLRWKYDELGRCIQSADGEGRIRHFEYDALGRLAGVYLPDGNKLRLQYNAYEEVTRAQDRNGQVEFEYTPMGQLTRKRQDKTEVRYLYDTAERLRSVVNEAGNYYRLHYNRRGEVIKETGFDGRQRKYERDVTGRVIRMERPGNQHTTYEYDANGRVIRVEYQDGSRALFHYDRNGRVVEAANEHTTVRFERDKTGRIGTEWQGPYFVKSRYDRYGARTGISSSLGTEIRIERDGGGLPASLAARWDGGPGGPGPDAPGGKQGVSWGCRMKYNLAGQETERVLPGGVKSEWSYDAAGRPGEHKVSAGSLLQSWKKYAWSAGNRLTQVFDSLSQAGTRFREDAMGNLVFAQYADDSILHRFADPVGNIYERKDGADRTYSPAGALLESRVESCRYDEAGNLSSRTEKATGKKWQYQWQGNGLLSKVIRPDGKEVGFQYDALGRRIGKSFDGSLTRYVWDGNTLLHEWKYKEECRPVPVVDEWGDICQDGEEPVEDLTSWIFDADSFVPVAKMGTDGAGSIVCDHLGTPQEMYNAEGKKIWEAALDIYGRVRPLTGDRKSLPFRYRGQYEDVETGLYYNGFRYYSPEAGTYISQDPTGLNGGMNAYAYVHNPNSWVDIFGLNGLEGLLVSENLKHLSLSDPSWRSTVFSGDQKGIVYMLKDNTTGEILKVGKSETGTFVGRFEKYQTAGTKTGRDLVADVLTIDKTNSHTLEAVENQARQNLEKLGHTLPWDNTKGRLGRPGPGVPFTRLNKSLREKYKWDAHGNLVKKCK